MISGPSEEGPQRKGSFLQSFPANEVTAISFGKATLYLGHLAWSQTSGSRARSGGSPRLGQGHPQNPSQCPGDQSLELLMLPPTTVSWCLYSLEGTC